MLNSSYNLYDTPLFWFIVSIIGIMICVFMNTKYCIVMYDGLSFLNQFDHIFNPFSTIQLFLSLIVVIIMSIVGGYSFFTQIGYGKLYRLKMIFKLTYWAIFFFIAYVLVWKTFTFLVTL